MNRRDFLKSGAMAGALGPAAGAGDGSSKAGFAERDISP